MQDSNTYDIIVKYCEKKYAGSDQAFINRQIKALARNDIFEAEKRLGKSFFLFNEDELEALFLSMKPEKTYKESNKHLSLSYLRWLVSYYKDLFQFYMDETKLYMHNPYHDRRFRSIGRRAYDGRPRATIETLERICLSIGEHFEYGEAEFVQLILWMFYSGFQNNDEIILLQESQVNLNNKTAVVKGRTINLADECVELLRKNHEIQEYRIHRSTNLLISWHGSYVRFPYRQSKPKDNTDSYLYAMEQNHKRDILRIRNTINQRMMRVRKEIVMDFKPDDLFFAGLHDRIAAKCSDKRMHELLFPESGRSKSEDAKELKELIWAFGGEQLDIPRTRDMLSIYYDDYNGF